MFENLLNSDSVKVENETLEIKLNDGRIIKINLDGRLINSSEFNKEETELIKTIMS